jgi:hypothetical protein
VDWEVMAERPIEPKTHLALDMDWMTALLVVIFSAFGLLWTLATARLVLIGAPVKLRITWEAVSLLLAFVWFAFQSRDRVAKFGCGLLGVVFGSRVLLAVFHASTEIQALNAQVMRVVELVVLVGFWIYLAHWFKQRIKRV